eukprot:7292552-Pyramimonas_sp.AAC.1
MQRENAAHVCTHATPNNRWAPFGQSPSLLPWTSYSNPGRCAHPPGRTPVRNRTRPRQMPAPANPGIPIHQRCSVC